MTNHHASQKKTSPLLDWYQRTTGNFVDRMCCVSYASQVDDGEEPVEYDEMRAKMVIPDWIEEYKHDTDQQQHASKPRKKHEQGHLTLQGDGDGCMGKCYFSPNHHSPSSVATATTVSTSTVRTSRTLASQSTINTSNRSGDDEIVVDDIVYVRSESLEERSTPREIDVPPAARYRRYRSHQNDRRESPPRLQSVPSDALPNLPYLTLTEGYEC
jgi:hypothetical protein